MSTEKNNKVTRQGRTATCCESRQISSTLPMPKGRKKLRDKEAFPRLERYSKGGG